MGFVLLTRYATPCLAGCEALSLFFRWRSSARFFFAVGGTPSQEFRSPSFLKLIRRVLDLAEAHPDSHHCFRKNSHTGSRSGIRGASGPAVVLVTTRISSNCL